MAVLLILVAALAVGITVRDLSRYRRQHPTPPLSVQRPDAGAEGTTDPTGWLLDLSYTPPPCPYLDSFAPWMHWPKEDCRPQKPPPPASVKDPGGPLSMGAYYVVEVAHA